MKYYSRKSYRFYKKNLRTLTDCLHNVEANRNVKGSIIYQNRTNFKALHNLTINDKIIQIIIRAVTPLFTKILVLVDDDVVIRPFGLTSGGHLQLNVSEMCVTKPQYCKAFVL